MVELVVFDGDDTLWSTEPLYDAARTAARRLVERNGFDGALWEATEREIDVANVALLGMSPQRFPTSCVQALKVVADGDVDPAMERDVWSAAFAVFNRRAPLLPATENVLALVATDYIATLLTKGDLEVQSRRVEQSGLRSYFKHIEVVLEKTTATFASMAERFSLPPSAAVSVGNSLRSDILPAVQAGMGAIWVDAHVWEWERASLVTGSLPSTVWVANSLADVPQTLKDLSTWV